MMHSILRKNIFLFFTILHTTFILAQADSTSRINLQQQLPTNDVWWQLFGDETLNTLIPKAVSNNSNLLNAMKNIELAKARLRVQQSGFYPSIDVMGSYTAEKTSKGIENIDQRDNIGEALVSMNWEVDVFGSIRKGAKAQKQQYLASQEDYRAVMVSLVAQLSSTYINLRTAQKQLEVARRNLKSQKEILDITETRFNTGLASKLSVAQAKSLYLQTKAMIPGMEAAIYQQINTICVLTGEYSESLQSDLLKIAPLPANKGILMTGIPAELIRQRPDVKASERNMDALSTSVGASRADWWPKFYVTGSFGYGSRNFEHLTQEDNMTWQIMPSIKWTIFSGRQLVQSTKIAMLQLDEGINNFNYTMLTAIQEVDDALISYNKSLQQLAADKDAFIQAAQTLQLSVELYQKGLADYQSVLDSQRTVLSFENALVAAESSTLLYTIQLYKALGGGWSE